MHKDSAVTHFLFGCSLNIVWGHNEGQRPQWNHEEAKARRGYNLNLERSFPQLCHCFVQKKYALRNVTQAHTDTGYADAYCVWLWGTEQECRTKSKLIVVLEICNFLTFRQILALFKMKFRSLCFCVILFCSGPDEHASHTGTDEFIYLSPRRLESLGDICGGYILWVGFWRIWFLNHFYFWKHFYDTYQIATHVQTNSSYLQVRSAIKLVIPKHSGKIRNNCHLMTDPHMLFTTSKTTKKDR